MGGRNVAAWHATALAITTITEARSAVPVTELEKNFTSQRSSIDMSDPHKLKSILLEDASNEHQKQFAQMLAEQCAEADLRAKGHKCWMLMPSPENYEIIKKYNQPPNYDKCPKCGKGRIVILITNFNMGQALDAICMWSGGGCDYKEHIEDGY